jgi:solute carrier family 25 (mitochondrial folate transporter), member 32
MFVSFYQLHYQNNIFSRPLRVKIKSKGASALQLQTDLHHQLMNYKRVSRAKFSFFLRGIMAKLTPWQSGCVALTASLSTNFALYPLDLLRSRLQVAATSRGAWRLDAALAETSRVWSSLGARGFYRGLSAGLAGPGVAWMTWMTAYRYAKQSQQPLTDYFGADFANFVAGVEAGVAMTLVTNPLFVVKIRLQTMPVSADGGVVPSFARTFYDLAAKEGVRGLYRGLAPALPLTMHAALHWTIFERIKRVMGTGDGELGVGASFAAAASSKVAAASLTFPLHVLKTCLQAHSANAMPSQLRTLVPEIYRRGGPLAFYSGFLPHLARTVPNATITMFLIEQISRFVEHWGASTSRVDEQEVE